MQFAFMVVQITIRGVPEKVRNELALRAAERRQSMQEYLRCELERMVSRPTIKSWLEGVRQRKAVTDEYVPSSVILRERDADRK